MAESQTVTQTVPLARAFELARQRHMAGDLDAARDIYQRVRAAAPDHAEADVMLASIAYRQGRLAEADGHLDRAIDLTRHTIQRKPDDAVARASVVNLLLARGRLGEAEALVRDLDLPLNPIRSTVEEFARRRRASIERGLPSIVISTMPKSASESIWNKLAEGLGLAQCHLSIGLFPDCTLIPSRVARAAEGGVVIKEHIGATAHNLATLARYGVARVIVHHRDPRQATLSWVHFARDDINRRLMAPLWRKIVPPGEILAADLGTQVDWCIESYLPRLVDFLQHWREQAANRRAPVAPLFLSFEGFRTDPAGYFDQVLGYYGIPRDRFAAEAEAEVVHLRKGEIDEWRTVFTEAQRRRAWELIPADMAAAFGWEP